jgi:hypothetical protein
MQQISRLTARICFSELHVPAKMLALPIVLFAGIAHAQLSGTGAISGTVTDQTGAVVPNATVIVTNVATNVQTIRTTTGAGDYNITPLTPGGYTVTVTAAGFQKLVQQNVTVDALATVALPLKLSVGGGNEVVTVTEAPPILSTTDATLGGVMDNEMYSNLPLQMGAGGNADQRRATDFAYLMPGVQANFTSNNATSNTGIVNGSGPAGGVQEVYIDGINLPEADQVGDPRFTWTAIGVDAIDQFQVQTAGIGAQYSGQGMQNYSIKQGGNAYHGSVYLFDRNTIFDAWNFTNKVPAVNAAGVTIPGGIKPRENQNEVGIVLSGPIIKNKLFLFGNYGQYRYSHGPSFAPFTLPTAAMLGYTQAGTALGYADYSGYALANPTKDKTGKIVSYADIYDPATQIPNCTGTSTPCSRAQFMGLKNGVPTADIIPASRFSAASNYYDKYLLAYEPLIDQTTYANNLNYGTATGLSNWYMTSRVDYTQSPKNQIGVIVAFGRQASTGPNSSTGLMPPFNASQSYSPVTTIDIVKDTFTISPHVVNQFAVGFGRYQSDSVTPDRQTQYAATTAGILNMPAGQASDGFPGITYSGNYDAPAVQGGYAWNSKVNNTYTVTDTVNWNFGRHNIVIGGQVVNTQFNYVKVESPSGPLAFTFSSNQTTNFSSATSTTLSSTAGSPVASYLLGAASAGTTNVNIPHLGTRWVDPSFWVQDDYKVNQKLTFNLGLRWDIYPSVREAHNLFTFVNPNGINSITGNKGTLEFAGSGPSDTYCNCSSPSPTWFKNVAPRLGVAYSVAPKAVIRASYNLIFARGNWTSGSQSGSPSTLGITPSASAPSGISSAPAFYWDQTQCTNGTNDGVACGWTGSIVNPTPPAGGTSLAEYGTTYTSALTNTGSATQTYFDPYLGSRTPEFDNWTIGLEQQLTNATSISVSYVGSQGHFISVTGNNYLTTNHLPEGLRALAGYNTSGTALTPCTGASCTAPLLAAKATTANLALASSLGFAPPNPYTTATYYASESVYQYYVQFPQFSGVSDTTSFTGNTAFHALEVSLRQRNYHGVDMMMNYTYSKSIDDVGTFRVYDNQRLDRSLSTTDQPQNLTLTSVYKLPFGHGHMGGDNFLVNAVGGGWTVSGIFVYHSGNPIAFTGTGCAGSSILGTCEPSLVPGVGSRVAQDYKSNPSGITAANYKNFSYFNPGAFSVNVSATGNLGAESYVPGNATRVGADNTFAMGFYNFDFALKRTFPLYEQFKLQFEADMLNATNHVIWGAPNSTVGGSTFGEYTAAPVNQARDFQLSGRINF